MATKKACVIFTAAKQAEAEQVVQRLSRDGYEVCKTEVTQEVAHAVKAEESASIPAEVADCLDGSEVCVILLDENVDASSMGGLAGIASDSGGRVITVGGNPEMLPTELDDIIDGHVPSAEAPDLIDIVKGRPDRIKSDNTPAAKRDEDRVKCQ